jgi:hypothetical protein
MMADYVGYIVTGMLVAIGLIGYALGWKRGFDDGYNAGRDTRKDRS